MRILILDDNPEILLLLTMMIRHALGSEPCEIIPAHNGCEGLSFLDSIPTPDLILTNLRMPYMDGLSFMREVRRNTRWARIPLIVVSADFSDMTREAAAAGGAVAFLPKPFDFAGIRSILHKHCHVA